MVNISISSLNCRGLNNGNKRTKIFNSVRNKEVIFLQETYITNQKANTWKSDWNGLFFYTPGTNSSKGLITLIKNDFMKNTVVFYKSERILGIKGTLDNEDYFFINVYGPNVKAERQNFMNELYNVTSKCTSHKVIIGGDFNIVLDNNLDIVSGAQHDQTTVFNFRKWVYRNYLIDSWRLLHAVEKEFTWSRNNPFCARRLDYIFINEDLSQFLLKSYHFTVSGTDHQMVNIFLSSNDSIRGQGYWKFNNDLLNDKNYLSFMNEKIDTFLENKFDDAKERLEYLKIMV